MTFKRTAVIKSGCGGVSLRNFVSEKELTHEIVMDLLADSGIKDRGQILIYDTPEVEEVKPKIVVQVAECSSGNLYIGINTDGVWSKFWQVDEGTTRDILIGRIVTIHGHGEIHRSTSEHRHWMGRLLSLTPVITYDGKQVVILVGKMGFNVKRYLDLYRS